MGRSGSPRRFPNPERASLFSRAFGIDDPDAHAWFDPILVRDNPVFVDPFLLSIIEEPEFSDAGEEVLEHFRLLYRAVARNPLSKVEQFLRFPEVPETCLGYTKIGTQGAGSGADRANQMGAAIRTAIAAGLESPTHFEEIGLLAADIGRDLISDITTRILMERFVRFTERVAREQGLETQQTRLWGYGSDGGEVNSKVVVGDLPRNPHSLKNRAILLVPRLVLRELPTINRDGFEDYLWSLHRDELVQRFNVAVKARLGPVVLEIARNNPTWVRDYMTWEERRGARPYSFNEDKLAVGPSWRAFYEAGRGTIGPPRQPTSASEMLDFVRYLTRNYKRQIEEADGYKELYRDEGCLEPKPESAVQRLYAAMARGTCELAGVRMSRESDAGIGSVDFLFTTGYEATALVETKLISNGKFWNGISAQLPAYMKSHDVKAGMFVGVAFTDAEVKHERYVALDAFVKTVAKELKVDMDGERVDARPRRTPPSKMKGTILPRN